MMLMPDKTDQVGSSGRAGQESIAPRTFMQRLEGYYRRRAASFVFKRPLRIDPERAIISFTFDDFPRSALYTGGAILKKYGVGGTYYACLGTAGSETATGRQFDLEDLKGLVDSGHELACHTFSHCHSWETATGTYERSIQQNREALQALLPGVEFKSFSYPICPPRPLTKARTANYFLSSRGGGQTFNSGIADLNQLNAFFLEKSADNLQAITNLIDRNNQARGWLVLATHDVCDTPTPYGVTPEFFEQVVSYADASGALILAVVNALEVLQRKELPERFSSRELSLPAKE
jgi:peptidoglycan/xylan/chitin deacetylase (PgdA/CDA1 family)